jgi:hypothetical protein
MKSGLFGAALVGAMAFGATRQANASVITYSGVETSFTVASSGVYEISAFGAQGGSGTVGGNQVPSSSGGLGAEVDGFFNLTAGDVLTILVGGAGANGSLASNHNLGAGGGGGGGSFVFDSTTSTLLAAAGGGGGGTELTGVAGGSGLAGTAGGNGTAVGAGTGGSSGSGGASGESSGGGGGFTSDGGTGTANLSDAGGGLSFADGGAGGAGAVGSNGNAGGNGGFGGGGGGAFQGHEGGGGGGGYSGGGAGGHGGGGGGGGSFLDASATVPTFTADINTGNGEVIITQESVSSVPEPGSLALLVSGLGLLAGALRRRRLG